MKRITIGLIVSSLMSVGALAAPSGYQSAVLADTPFAYYRVGEASGTSAADTGGNNFTGSYLNAPTLGVAGYGGDTAVTFNGTSQYVSSPATDFGTNLAHASFEFVFQTTNTVAQKALTGSFNTGSTAEAFVVSLNETAAGSLSANAGLVRLFIRDQSGTAVGASFANATAFDGNYHHLVYTYNSTGGTNRVRAYLDGVPQTVTYGTGGNAGSPVNFVALNFAPAVAARNVRGTIGQFFQGTMDEAALYATTLSVSQVVQHFQSLIDPGLTNLAWAVGNGTWDINTTANWTNASAGAQVVYVETNGIGNRVRFDDSASGSSPIAITLDTVVRPRSITNNSTKNYTISGTGSIGGLSGITKSGAGTLTLNTSGVNTFTGPVNLTGGVLEFSANNLGGGTPPPITFSGGTLRYASGNVDDISLNTVTFAGSATIDVGANPVTFANGVGASGAGSLTKSGSGTLTLGGINNYSGNTVIADGTLALAFGATIPSSPAIIVNSGKTLDAVAGGLTLGSGVAQILAGVGTVNGAIISSNGVITPATNGVVGTLTFGNDLTVAGGSLVIDLNTNSAQRDLVVVVGNLSLYGGALQLNVTGTLTNGVYKLIQYTGTLVSGANSSANLLLTGYTQPGSVLALSDSTPNEITLVVTTESGTNIVWQGDGGNNYWDIATTANFTNSSGVAVTFAQGDRPTFNDTSANATVNLNAALQPATVVVTATANNYVFQDGTGTGAGKLTGGSSIAKNGSGTLTIATANLNTGPTVINAGTLQVGNGGALGDLGGGNVTNNGALVFNQSDNHAVGGAISGSGSVTQQGAGTVTLVANNTYSGLTTISSGTLQIGNGGTTGTLGTNNVANNGGLAFNRNSIQTIANNITGGGSVAVNSGTVTLTGNNSYTGGTIVNAGKLIRGNTSAVPQGQNLTVEAAGTNDLNGLNLTVSRLNSAAFAGGRIVNNAGPATNVLTIDYDGASTADGSIAILDNEGTGGKIALVKTGIGEQILRSASSYTGGTIISNGILQMRSSLALGTGRVLFRGGDLSLAGGLTIPNAFQAETNFSISTAASGNTLFTGDFTTSSNITFNLSGGEVWSMNGTPTQLAGVTGTIFITGAGTFRFITGLGSANTTFDLTGSTATINNQVAGTFTLGALIGDTTPFLGGTPGATFVIGGKNLSTTFAGTVNAVADNLVKVGTGTFTLSGSYGFTGSTTVSNGVLALVEPVSLDSSPTIALRSSTATLDVSARTDGTLNLGAVVVQTLSGIGTINGSVLENAGSFVSVGLGTLNVTNVATLNGELIMQLNRTNAINASKLTAGTLVNAAALTVTNIGPALQGGDTFQLFNGAVTGFTVTNLPALTGGLTWTDNLAVNGSIAVVSAVNQNPPPILTSFNGTTLSLSWPTNAGWTLQQQTNSLTTGLSTNWVDVPGSTSITSTNITVDPTKPTVFYRLKL